MSTVYRCSSKQNTFPRRPDLHSHPLRPAGSPCTRLAGVAAAGAPFVYRAPKPPLARIWRKIGQNIDEHWHYESPNSETREERSVILEVKNDIKGSGLRHTTNQATRENRWGNRQGPTLRPQPTRRIDWTLKGFCLL